MWQLRTWAGTPEEFHSADLFAQTDVPQIDESVVESSSRAVWNLKVHRDTLVLGSRQGHSLVDTEMASACGVDIVTRRSGGGAVWLPREGVVWLDVLLGPDDPLWSADVRQSVTWLGDVWRAAIIDLSGNELMNEHIYVHSDALDADQLGEKICFVSHGPGEVLVHDNELGVRKIVGISQRRTRLGARFQCAMYTSVDHALLARLMRLDVREAQRLNDSTQILDRHHDEIVATFLSHLPISN